MATQLVPEPLIVETAERVFERVAGADAPDGTAAAWAEVESAGLAVAWVEEALGGAGASLVDGLAVARSSARHAVALPVAETLLASWTLARAGIASPGGPLTLAVDTGAPAVLGGDGTVSGTLRRVAFARHVPGVVMVVQAQEGWAVALVDGADLPREERQALSGEPRDDLRLDGVTPRAIAATGNDLDPAAALRVAALVRSWQMAGALERALEISLGYVQERVQFGRTLSRFQAVQHELAKLAGECTAAGAAAGAGAAALARFGVHDERTARACAAAKIRVGEAAGAGAAIAHQVHGAMGFSEEYLLQRFTRRLWTWRDDFGAEAWWAAWLGRQVAAAGASALWPALTAG